MKDNEIKVESNQPVQSPCIGNCCLDNKDVCVGCYRTIEEIISWREYNQEQRIAVIERCQERKGLA